MIQSQLRMATVQNEGAIDRVTRGVIGWAMLGIASFDLYTGASATWHGYVMLLSVYPILTSILGWDPIYQLMHKKTCSTSDRNKCGSFPYEVASMLGRNPKCSNELHCELHGHEEKTEKRAS